jgi:hypothetical protein
LLPGATQVAKGLPESLIPEADTPLKVMLANGDSAGDAARGHRGDDSGTLGPALGGGDTFGRWLG